MRARISPYRLSIHGPYSMPCATMRNLRSVDRRNEVLRDFWQRVVGTHGSDVAIGGKDGCYVFSMRLSRGYTPWYVGKTDRRLDVEVFTADKILKYNEVLAIARGTPVLFLVTSSEHGKSKLPSRIVDRLESDLIRSAYRKNPNLRNEKKLVDPLPYVIDGIGTRGKPSEVAHGFRKMMGLSC